VKTLTIVAAALLVAVGLAAFGLAAIFSPSVHTTDAYRAGGATTGGSERTMLANAAVEGDPPSGFTPGPRLRQPGTLARLRYETFAADGAPLDAWEARAIVPPVPDPDTRGGAYEPNCPSECQDRIRRGATLVVRSGNPGLASEWVLRMPLNRAFDLGSQAMTTQDLLDDRARQVSIHSIRRDGVEAAEPSRITVALVDACAARVSAASVTHLEFLPDAIVPVPRGFRTYRWTELEGCGRLDPLPPPPLPPPPPPRAVPPPPPDLRAIAVRRGARGFTALDVDESWFARHPKPIEFVLRDVCRYDDSADQWTRVAMPTEAKTIRIEPRKDAATTPRPVVALPEEIGLFYARWIEREDGERSARMQSLRDTLATSGPTLCNDIDLGPAPAGRVAACVPSTGGAQARFVPDPQQQCGR